MHKENYNTCSEIKTLMSWPMIQSAGGLIGRTQQCVHNNAYTTIHWSICYQWLREIKRGASYHWCTHIPDNVCHRSCLCVTWSCCQMCHGDEEYWFLAMDNAAAIAWLHGAIGLHGHSEVTATLYIILGNVDCLPMYSTRNRDNINAVDLHPALILTLVYSTLPVSR